MAIEKVQLHDFLVNHFGQDEIKLLAFDLGVDHKLFNYQNKQKLSLELVAYFERRSRLGCLLTELMRRRPLNNLDRLLAKLPPCAPTTKIQVIVQTTAEVAADVEAFLQLLANKHTLDREAVSLVAVAQGSSHLLLSLPEAAARTLAQSANHASDESFAMAPFAELPERTQKVWSMIALEWPPLTVQDKLLPRISWQKAAEIYRLREKDELLRRLVAGDRFGSHGTRVALAALSGYAQLLALTAVPGEKQAGYIEKLVRASDDLSENLTVMYSLIGSREEEVAVQSLLQYLLPTVTPIAEMAAIQLDLHLADGLAKSQRPVRCNLVLLAQAVGSLVRHAVLLSGENGRIQLSAHLGDSQFVIQVQDEGKPIPPEEVETIFEAGGSWSYLQAPDPAQVGSGLGLPIVKMVIQQMDGKIWYEPGEGRGNTFCISLPAVD